MKKAIFTVVASVLYVGSALACSAAIAKTADACAMQENVSLSVSFNLSIDSFAQAKAKYDEKIASINELAKKQGIKKLDVQSSNYSVNSNSGYSDGAAYQLNGNVSYQMDNQDSAFKLADFLTQQKIQVNVSSSSYKNGNCVTPPGLL